MKHGGLVYYGEKYFRDGELFSIIPYNEPLKKDRRLHTHDFVEICYVYEGSGFHELGGREWRVSKGDLFLINYDDAHAFYRGAADETLRTYNILFKPGFLDENLLPFHDFSSLTMSYLFKGDWDDDLVRADLRLPAADQKKFDQLIVRMHREYTQRQEGYHSIIRAHMIELIVRIMRGFNKRVHGEPMQTGKAASIEAALRHLETHYNEPVHLVDLARKSFVSKNYFCRLFKETTGVTVSQYTQQVRIEEAAKMIKESDASIAAIASEVGFTDYKAFYLAFRRHKGLSPNAYRNLT